LSKLKVISVNVSACGADGVLACIFEPLDAAVTSGRGNVLVARNGRGDVLVAKIGRGNVPVARIGRGNVLVARNGRGNALVA